MAGYVYRRGKSWYVAYRDADGMLRRESSRVPTKELAKQLLARRQVEWARALVAGLSRTRAILFRSFAAMYLKWSRENKRPLSALRDRQSVGHLEKVFGAKSLAEIRALDIEQYKMQRRQWVGPATVNRELACLRHMLNLAVQWEYLRENPFKGKVKLYAESRGVVRFLAVEEERRLLAYAIPQIRPIILTALHTGMRRGELLGVRWGDVSLGEGLITVRQGKGGRVRHIPINETLRSVLEELPRHVACPNVFWNPATGLGYVTFDKTWARTVKRAGIESLRFHDLRHTFASRLVQAGVPLLEVKELLGHSTIQMTMRYAHLAPSNLKRAVAVLDRPAGTTQIATHLSGRAPKAQRKSL